MSFELLNPDGLESPVGYSHVAAIASGKMVFVAGQAPFDPSGSVVGKGDFVAQFRQVMSNLRLAVEGVGGHPDQFAILTIYVTDLQAYLTNKKPIGVAYQNVFGRHFPAITLVEVKSLYHPDCMVEISGMAVVD
ncbi:MAG: RidA family protein [Candidatus Binatia bacterium]